MPTTRAAGSFAKHTFHVSRAFPAITPGYATEPGDLVAELRSQTRLLQDKREEGIKLFWRVISPT